MQKYADQLDSVAMSRQDSDMSSSVIDGNSGNYSKLKYSGEEHVANITRGIHSQTGSIYLKVGCFSIVQ